jgi:hypothetical protein
MGLVTIDKNEELGIPMLKIPNYSIKTMIKSILIAEV